MGLPIATCLVRDRPHYRHEVFHQALKRLGYEVRTAPARAPGEHDILVIWNRYGLGHQQAVLHERAGAAVVVAENGYLPAHGTQKTFALALNQHNGGGRWYVGNESRISTLAIDLKPWRHRFDGETVILPQRGIGPPGVAMPREWVRIVNLELTSSGCRNIRLRQHPGGNKKAVPLERDLTNAARCITWGSGAAVKALIEGVPVFYQFRRWIGGAAARFGVGGLNDPVLSGREEMLEHLAWAQWSVEELATGDPLKHLIELHKGSHE